MWKLMSYTNASSGHSSTVDEGGEVFLEQMPAGASRGWELLHSVGIWIRVKLRELLQNSVGRLMAQNGT